MSYPSDPIEIRGKQQDWIEWLRGRNVSLYGIHRADPLWPLLCDVVEAGKRYDESWSGYGVGLHDQPIRIEDALRDLRTALAALRAEVERDA